MKHEWRKHEKELYLPKAKPMKIFVPTFKFFTIEGAGNPKNDTFSRSVEVLYALSYAIKMSPKKGLAPQGYFDYTVYPLEGVWDVNEEAKRHYTVVLDKDTLVFKLMIRQPDFVDEAFAAMAIEQTKKKKSHEFLDKVTFEKIEEGNSIQMLHLGSFDNEPESFELMEKFTASENLVRVSKVHREIYLSDARKVSPEKLKTVLRFKVMGA